MGFFVIGDRKILFKVAFEPTSRFLVDELCRVVRNECFDESPMTDLNSEAVDFRAASECFEPVRRLKRRDLFGQE